MIMFGSSRCGDRTAVTRVSGRHLSPNPDWQAAILTISGEAAIHLAGSRPHA
jgi:hypothetical protein